MLKEVLENMRATPHEPKRYLDATFGRGGHCRAVLEAFPGIEVVAIDRDPQAIAYGRESFEGAGVRFVEANYSQLSGESLRNDLGKFDLILVDLGVSSPQLDIAERGFSFLNDGPLDMRMNPQETLTAAEIINNWDSEELVRIFMEYGEICNPTRVVHAITKARKVQPIASTGALAQIIVKTLGWKKRGHHPATRFFLALRLVVNAELEHLSQALPSLVGMLNDGGRLLVISFHSTEDRIVKRGLKALKEEGSSVHKHVVKPTYLETKENPRARSAKLRVFERSNT
jgi:16S rRNA (cytosine1402-N4)-methyltransferase